MIQLSDAIEPKSFLTVMELTRQMILLDDNSRLHICELSQASAGKFSSRSFKPLPWRLIHGLYNITFQFALSISRGNQENESREVESTPSYFSKIEIENYVKGGKNV